MPPAPPPPPPDPDYRRDRRSTPSRPRPPTALRAAVAAGALFGDAARRRHRLGQDRGLFRGGRRGAAARPAGADPPSRDRADRRFPRPLRRAASARARRNGIRRSRRGCASGSGAASPTGAVRVVVGARSALFLPFAELGLIVVDEEHDLAYKQEERVFYNARDMAVVRGHLAGFPVVLSSATPSIECRVNADAGRYRRLVLQRPLPARRSCPRSRADRPARATRRSAAASCRRRSSPRSARRSPSGSRRSSSSTAAAMRRSPSAAPAATASSARTARPGWSSTASAACSSATIAAIASGGRRPARTAATTESLVAGRAGRRAARRGGRRALSRRRARSSCRATSPAASSGCGSSLQAIAKGEVDIVIGTQLVAKGHNFPLPDAGRRGRRRSRPRLRRHARGGAHLPAPHPGDRPRRPRRRRQPRAAPDLSRRSIR